MNKRQKLPEENVEWTALHFINCRIFLFHSQFTIFIVWYLLNVAIQPEPINMFDICMHARVRAFPCHTYSPALNRTIIKTESDGVSKLMRLTSETHIAYPIIIHHADSPKFIYKYSAFITIEYIYVHIYFIGVHISFTTSKKRNEKQNIYLDKR